jgi:hypothetical protein
LFVLSGIVETVLMRKNDDKRYCRCGDKFLVDDEEYEICQPIGVKRFYIKHPCGLLENGGSIGLKFGRIHLSVIKSFFYGKRIERVKTENSGSLDSGKDARSE